MSTCEIIKQYYDAFNRNDMDTFFALLAEDIEHDINQGKKEKGKIAFQQFMQHMNECYREKVTDLHLFTTNDPHLIAAEFMIEGTYIKTDPGFKEAKGQTYHLPAGAFFTVKNNKITRVTNYYNIKQWIELIS